jgi:hypothetical protein
VTAYFESQSCHFDQTLVVPSLSDTENIALENVNDKHFPACVDNQFCPQVLRAVS